LGLSQLPARANFKGLVRAYLLPRALGIDSERGRKRLRTPDGLRAAVLAGPEAGASRTLQQTVDQLVWRALDLPADGPLTLNKLRERVLARHLGHDRPLPLARAIRLAAAGAAGARRTEPDALAEAVLRRWVREEPAAPSARAHPPERDQDDSLARFAREVLAHARDPRTPRFTDEKAFIESVWRRATEARTCAQMDLDSFKARLLEAHRLGLLVLSRADLRQLISPRDLEASEIEIDGAAFHFVRTDLPEVTT
jgi:hypothetical protein